MTASGATPEAASADGGSCPWLVETPYFRRVVSFHEATDLLADHHLDADLAGLFEAMGVTSGPVWEATKASLLSLNGDEHRHARSLVAPFFTPRAVERSRAHLSEAAGRLTDRLPSGADVDFVSEFAHPLVTATTCRHVGFEAEEELAFRGAIELIALGSRDLAQHLGDFTAGLEILIDQSKRALSTRRAAPRSDVLTSLAADVDAGRLREDIAATLVASLMSAGHEPAINQVGLMILVLSEHGDLWESVGSGDLSVHQVVEELLRFRSTNQGALRRVNETFSYAGASFKAGQNVVVDFGSANHDPSHFGRPDACDPAANQGPHLAFGFGPHYCLGAALARAQLQEALRSLTQRFQAPEVVEVLLHEGDGLVAPLRLIVRFESRTDGP